MQQSSNNNMRSPPRQSRTNWTDIHEYIRVRRADQSIQFEYKIQTHLPCDLRQVDVSADEELKTIPRIWNHPKN